MFIFLMLLLSLSFNWSSHVQCNMMAEMAVMMGAQMGASKANQEVSAIFAEITKEIGDSQSNITRAIKAFQTSMTSAQKDTLKNTYQLFQKAQTNIQTLNTKQQAQMQNMTAYIQQAISRQQPQSHYLSDGALYDQYFTLGTMYTPKGPVWKNIFPIGNWEYDETSDSFWQMSCENLSSSNTNAINSGDKSPNNSIFTEWITQKQSYDIECDITLYQVTYPFFVGIIFNKARWISGDQTRLQSYRLFGVYGTQTNTNTSIQTCFAEMYPKKSTTTPSTGKQASTQYHYPLEQIIAGNASYQANTLNKTPTEKKVFQNISAQPIILTLKITTSPNQIQCKIWNKNITAEPAEFITIPSKNMNLYLYHGIGFMSPGAMAQFKLKKPTSLLFQPSAIHSFKGEVEAFINQKINQLVTSSILNVATAGESNS